MTSTLPGADIRGFYRALGVLLPDGRPPRPPCAASPTLAHTPARTAIPPVRSTSEPAPGTAGVAARAAAPTTPRSRSGTPRLGDGPADRLRARGAPAAVTGLRSRPPRRRRRLRPAPRARTTAQAAAVGGPNCALERALITQPSPVAQLRGEQRRYGNDGQPTTRPWLGRGRVISRSATPAAGCWGCCAMRRAAPRFQVLAMAGTRLGWFLVPTSTRHRGLYSLKGRRTSSPAARAACQ